MGLEIIIDPHSHNVQKASQNPHVWCNQNQQKARYSHLKMSKFTKKCIYVRIPYISLLILPLLNRCISVKTSVINTKLGNFVNLGVLFLTMWINSCSSHNLNTRTQSFTVLNQAMQSVACCKFHNLGAYHFQKNPEISVESQMELTVTFRKIRQEIVGYLQRKSSFSVQNATAEISLPFP